MFTRISFVVAATLGLAFAVSGVGHGAAAGGRQAGSHVVLIENMKFTPGTLEIRAGDSVTFKNSDLVPHTATTKPKQPASFDSGIMKPGDSWTVTLQAAEPIHYGCIFHPTMEGMIVVRE